jgi:hypothetical protein
MPQSRFDWHERIKAVEREYRTTRVAVNRLSEVVARDPQVLGNGRTPRDLLSADENLEGTYVVRMFAEFETGLRSYWRTFRPHARPQIEVLLNQIGDRRGVPVDIMRAAHIVREYRNKLVHDRDKDVEHVTIEHARSRLSKYLARLPTEWRG